MKKVSIVTPCYNEAVNIPAFHAAVSRVFETLPYELEMVFVNDGSMDGTQDILLALSAKDSRVKYIEFERNFGQQAATSAGLHHATGDAIMMMDVDLQHSPTLIPAFIQKWEEGSDAVFGVRRSRAEESLFRSIGSKTAAVIIGMSAGSSLPNDASDFSIMDRRVVEAFKKLPAHAVMTRFQIARVSKKRTFIPFDVAPRAAGESKYTMLTLAKLLWKSTVGASTGVIRYAIRNTNFHD